jgi:hypothetical protein
MLIILVIAPLNLLTQRFTRFWCTRYESRIWISKARKTALELSRFWLRRTLYEFRNYLLLKQLFTWDESRKPFSRKTIKSASCWNSSLSRRSTRSFDVISCETTRRTSASAWFVITRLSNAITAEFTIT